MKEYERPTAITVISFVFFVGIITTLFIALSGITPELGFLYQVQLILSTLVGGFIGFGFWTMQKWAPVAYVGLIILSQIFLIFSGLWNFLSLLLPGIVALVGFYYYPQMRSGWSDPSKADLPGWSTVKIGLGAIASFFVISALAIGGFRIYLNTVTPDSNHVAGSAGATTTVSFENIEDKELARNLKKIMPQPSDFSESFSVNNSRFTKDSNGEIAYTAKWSNDAADKIKAYREESGGKLQQPVPQDMKSAAQDTQMFILSISHIGTTTDPFADLRNNFSKLPAALRAEAGNNIVAKQSLSGVGEDYYSYQLSPPANPAKFSYYFFRRNGYRVDFIMFVSFNEKVFEEDILPKARIIDQKIQNIN